MIKTVKLIFLTLTGCTVIFTIWGCTSANEPEWPVGCPHGEDWLPNVEDPDTPGAYFDFSEGEIVYGEEAKVRGDIFIYKTFVRGNPQLNVALHPQQPDSLLYDATAPSWGSENWRLPPDANTPSSLGINGGHNVWVRTGEGHTAKFKILLLESNEDVTMFTRVKIQWIYQPDGSESFHDVAGAAPEGEQ